jgi:hypothetical protein
MGHLLRLLCPVPALVARSAEGNQILDIIVGEKGGSHPAQTRLIQMMDVKSAAVLRAQGNTTI